MKQRFLALAFLSASVCILPAAEFFVAQNGNDSNQGTEKKPFASVVRAQQAVRAARAVQPEEAVTVTFQPGMYSLSETLVLTPTDSGASAEAPVFYKVNGSGRAVFSGGVLLNTKWEKDDAMPGVWKTKLPQGTPAFEQLWVNNNRAVRARTPNYWEFAQLQGISTADIPGQAENEQQHIFNIDRDMLEPFNSLSSEELHDVQIHVFHKWDTTREWFDQVNSQRGLLYTKGKKMQSWNSMSPENLYYLENYKAALDAPGEWFRDREGWLYYYPLKGQKMEQCKVVYPRLKRLLNIEGVSPSERVKHITFEGIFFNYSEFNIPAGGMPPGQAAMNCKEETVLLNHAEDIHFIRCGVEHTGNVGVWIKEDCRHCSLDTTRLFDLGAGGLRIGEPQIKPENERTCFISVNNCIIQSGGRIHPSAVGVWIGQSCDNQITHNEISDFIYTGVSVGWTWGYANSVAQRNQIAYNHIHHIGYKILSDMGGIYTLGNEEGTVLKGNCIHDIYSSSYGGWGLYPDEGTTGMLLENNLVYNTKDGGFHQHYGKDNIVRNNIFAFSEEGQIAVTRKEDHTSFYFEKNIVLFYKGRLLGYGGWNAGAKVVMDNNLYWNMTGNPIDFAGKTFEEWKATGRDQHSIIANPLFVDAPNYDFHFLPNSPAEKIGFVPFDYTQAGVYGDTGWIATARMIRFPGFAKIRQAPPVELSEDFEQQNASFFLSIAKFNDEGKKLIARSDEQAASGKYSLKIQNAEDVHFSFNPHLFFDPRYTKGALSLSYKIYLGAGCTVMNEIRSDGNPYLVGPSLLFKDGRLVVEGKKLMDVPVGKWVEIFISAPMGAAARGEWSLVVTLPDGTTQKFRNLNCGNSDWNRTRWIGFCAMEKNSTTFYIDDLQVKDLQGKNKK